jgi:mannose-6-phosphate isomerase-like protein (cupin superfamily)
MLRELRAVLLRDLDAAAREVEAYPSDEALWSTAGGITNSGGVLARHLAGNLRHFIGHLLGGNAYVRNRDDEFANRGLPRAAVAAELRAAHAEVGATLDALPLARLSDPFPVEVANRRFSTLQFLLHLSAHFGYHLGQLDYHRRQLSGDAKPVGAMGLDVLREIPKPAGAAALAGAAGSSAATFVALDAAFERIPEPWSPVVVGELNGQEVKAVRLRGTFDWHAHRHEDELFLVHRGELRMEFRDRAVTARAGEFIIVPRGTEHRPAAEHGAEVVLFEPVGIVRTGD